MALLAAQHASTKRPGRRLALKLISPELRFSRRPLCRSSRLDRKVIIFDRELYIRALADLATDQAASKSGFEVALQEALQRPRAEDRFVTLLRRPLLRFRIELHGHTSLRESLVQVGHEDVHDARDFFQRERLKRIVSSMRFRKPKLSTKALLETLLSPNAYAQASARRVLLERGKDAVVTELKAWTSRLTDAHS